MYNSIKCLYPNAEVKKLSEEKEVTLSLLKPFSKNPFTVLKDGIIIICIRNMKAYY
jgi:hypothetical protein